MKVMNIFRYFLDTLVTLVLMFVLLWCGILAWGAYSQHRITVLLNANALEEMKNAIQTQTTAAPTNLPVLTDQEITRLQDAQNNLFNENTQSFIYQFVTLIILTVGTSVLVLMYSQYKREQERANKVEKARIELLSSLAPFARGQNICILIASKYCLLYTMCRLYTVTNGPERNHSLMMMLDYQNDILSHLEYARREKEGFEPFWHEVILDMTDHVNRMLEEIQVVSGRIERTAVERILSACQKSHDILWNYGEEFTQNYDINWHKLTGNEPLPNIYE